MLNRIKYLVSVDALHNDEVTCLSRSDHAAEISAVALEVKPGWCLRSSFLCPLVGTRLWLLHCSTAVN